MPLSYYLSQPMEIGAYMLGVSTADWYVARRAAEQGMFDIDSMPDLIQAAVCRVLFAHEALSN